MHRTPCSGGRSDNTFSNELFARAIGADKGDQFLVPDVDRNIGQGSDAAELQCEVARFQHGGLTPGFSHGWAPLAR